MKELIKKMENKNLIKLNIQEIFSSIQGEGLFVGERQIFIRFLHCNLDCNYCDTKKTIYPYPLPLNKNQKNINTYLSQLIQTVKRLEDTVGPHHSLSLTGGEPLLHIDYLNLIIPAIKKLKLKIYLETNGTCYKEFEAIKHLVDIVSMDIKLPSACKEAYWNEHKKFLTIANDQKLSTFVKIVLTSKTTQGELEKAVKLITGINKNIPLILQPVSPIKNICPPPIKKMLAYHSFAKKHLKEVRLIPQIHKILGIK